MATDQNDQQQIPEPLTPDASVAEENIPQANEPDTDAAPPEAQSTDQINPNQEEIIPDLPDFSGLVAEALESSIELIKDVDLNVKIELGRTEMTVNEILKLSDGAVVELDKLAGDPVDVLVNEQLVARGEVLVLNDNFCVRINEIIPGIAERMARE